MRLPAHWQGRVQALQARRHGRRVRSITRHLAYWPGKSQRWQDRQHEHGNMPQREH
jgi:hypothetical protein